jgi:4-amino-4-deoxychorismate lyase
MCRFVESIQLKDGIFKRIELHQARLQKSMMNFYPNSTVIDLVELLKKVTVPTNGLFKCRVVYDSEVRLIEIVPYIRREIRSLKLVETGLESSIYKTENRSGYNAAFAQRGDCDDVLVFRNELLTDTSYCNIALYNGKEWFTPRMPLIFGVNRTELVENKMLIEKDIKIGDLKDYSQIALFNAMIEFGDLILHTTSIFR